MATGSSISNMNHSQRSEDGDGHVQSRLEAVRQYEGDGAGTVINEHYSQEDYSKRRLGFLGRHPDYEHDIKLLPKVRRDADEVFDYSQPTILSVQKIRQRELNLDIDPLLPLPTFDNTQTIDNFSAYPTTEWEPGMPTDQAGTLHQARPGSSLSPSPGIPGLSQAHDTTEDAGNEIASVHDRPSGAPRGLANRVDSVRKLSVDHAPAAVSDKPSHSGNSAQSNMSDNNLPGGKIDQNQQTANTPPRRATSNPSQDDADTAQAPNTMADTVLKNPPSAAQLQDVLDLLAQPLPRSNGSGAVAGRAVNVPVEPQGIKRTAPPETEETCERASQTAGPPASKKVKLNPPKTPSAAEPAPPARGDNREDATTTNSEAAASATTSSSRRPKKPRSINGIPISSNADDVAAGRALPNNAKTATAAQKLRRQHLTKQRKGKRSGMRAPDLKPEFWQNMDMKKIKGPDDGPVRCVCGTWADDGTHPDDWTGCEAKGCMCWQHIACVGEAYKGVDARYRCHQCDPYAHRIVLQKLRAGGSEEVKRPE